MTEMQAFRGKCLKCGDTPLEGYDWAGEGDVLFGQTEPHVGGLGVCGDLHEWAESLEEEEAAGRRRRLRLLAEAGEKARVGALWSFFKDLGRHPELGRVIAEAAEALCDYRAKDLGHGLLQLVLKAIEDEASLIHPEGLIRRPVPPPAPIRGPRPTPDRNRNIEIVSGGDK